MKKIKKIFQKKKYLKALFFGIMLFDMYIYANIHINLIFYITL